MKHPSNQSKGRPFLDILEESLHLLRTAPLSITLNFYFGTIPFVLALLFFCMDFSQSSYSGTEAALAALGLALLYAWMKTWQAIFCHQLRIWLCGSSSPRWTIRNFFTVFLQQLILQPSSFIVVPFSLIIALPFGWVYAFYQNISVLGDGSETSLKKLCGRAWSQASLWPRQNHQSIWLISPVLLVAASTLLLTSFYIFARINPYWMLAPRFSLIAIAFLLGAMALIANPCGAVVALNFGTALFLLPSLLKMLTGVETIFTLNTSYMISATFLITVCSLTYLTLEPLVKSFYVLRCFYGDSIRTGEDLKAGLQLLSSKRLAKVAVLVLLFFSILYPVSSQTVDTRAQSPIPAASVAPGQLNDSIDRIMSGRKYSWRNPNHLQEEKTEKGFFGYLLDVIAERLHAEAESLGKIFGNFIEWMENLFKDGVKSKDKESLGTLQGNWPSLFQIVLWILTLFLVLLLIRALLPLFRKKKPASLVAQPLEAQAPTDVACDTITASDLESDEWEVLAEKLLQEGNLRLAQRAFYLSTLSFLGRKELLQLKRHKTNRDYERELKRKIHSQPDLLQWFSQNLSLYERSWYGLHEATPETLRLFTENQKRIRHSLET